MRNTKMQLITIVAFSLSTASSLAAENTNALPTISPMTYHQLDGKGPGMGHDYQKNTSSLTHGSQNYRGGQADDSEKKSSPQESSNTNSQEEQAVNASQQVNEQGTELQKDVSVESPNSAPSKNQSASGVGFRSQGGLGYPQHKQFGTPPIQQATQPSQNPKKPTSGTIKGISPDSQIVNKSPTAIAAEKRRAILHAAGFGDAAALEKLLKEGGNPNSRAKNKTSRTALILAAIGGKLGTINVLLAHEAKLEDKDFAGNTALNWAALRGHTQVVSALIKKGANINTQNNAGASPVHYAVSIHNIPMLKMLIENGADLEVEASKYKVTPLQIAIEKKDTESLDILVEKGAKISDKNREIIKKIKAGK